MQPFLDPSAQVTNCLPATKLFFPLGYQTKRNFDISVTAHNCHNGIMSLYS